MPQPRTPLAKAQASGAAAKNPQRFRDRKAPVRVRPLGEPYVNMTNEEKAAWVDMAGDMPWLHSGHRVLLRMTCHHVAMLHAGEDFSVNRTQLVSGLLSKLGATPVDETKVNHAGDGDEDPDDRFFSGKSN